MDRCLLTYCMFLALPASVCRAALHVALDTGNTTGIHEEMITENDAWEDIPMELDLSSGEVQVDPSYEGGEYFHYIDLAHDSLNR